MARKRETHKPKNNQKTYLLPNTAKHPTLIPGILNTLFNNTYALRTIIIWGNLRK